MGAGKLLLIFVVLATVGLLSYSLLFQPASSSKTSGSAAASAQNKTFPPVQNQSPAPAPNQSYLPATNQTSPQTQNQTSPPTPNPVSPPTASNQSSTASPTPPQSNSIIAKPTPIKVASWNLQVFGQSKASNATLMDRYVSVMKGYDVVFVQEIRDSSSTAFAALCRHMESYSCVNSSRAGRSSSKEQYGLMFGPAIELEQWTDYNPAQSSLFERPPAEAKLRSGNYSFDAYIIHIKPSNVSAELYALQSLVADRGNVILLGDFNADCDYFKHSDHPALFSNWTWAVTDDEDTTAGRTDCSYDRILLNTNASAEYARHGVLKSGITPDLSDHYLVWAEIIPQES